MLQFEINRNRDLGIPVPDYVDENVSDKVVKIIQSYTGVVNKMVVEKRCLINTPGEKRGAVYEYLSNRSKGHGGNRPLQ